MRNMTIPGTILIRTNTAMPGDISVNSEPYLPGWRRVTNFDGHELGRRIHAAGWNFFCIAGEGRAIAFGIDEEKMLSRAMARMLAGQKVEFNSLEITRVASTHFFGLRYAEVFARSRHIQESIFLVPSKDLQEHGRDRNWRSTSQHTSSQANKPAQGETLAQPDRATTLAFEGGAK